MMKPQAKGPESEQEQQQGCPLDSLRSATCPPCLVLDVVAFRVVREAISGAGHSPHPLLCCPPGKEDSSPGACWAQVAHYLLCLIQSVQWREGRRGWRDGPWAKTVESVTIGVREHNLVPGPCVGITIGKG